MKQFLVKQIKLQFDLVPEPAKTVTGEARKLNGNSPKILNVKSNNTIKESEPSITTIKNKIINNKEKRSPKKSLVNRTKAYHILESKFNK